jgi:hypothetical protein
MAIRRPARIRPVGNVDTDDFWDLARSVDVAPGCLGLAQDRLGVVVARAHATGWFIRASFRDGLAPRDTAVFKEFVTQRVYVLLQDGPRSDAWVRRTGDEWVAYCGADMAVGLTDIPPTVPPHWQ